MSFVKSKIDFLEDQNNTAHFAEKQRDAT